MGILLQTSCIDKFQFFQDCFLQAKVRESRQYIFSYQVPGTFDGNRRAVGMLNPMRDKKLRHVPGGRRDDTCDHGLLSRRSLGYKTSYELGWKVKVMKKKKTYSCCCRDRLRCLVCGLNLFRTAVPFWEQTTRISSSLSRNVPLTDLPAVLKGLSSSCIAIIYRCAYIYIYIYIYATAPPAIFLRREPNKN